MKDFKSIEIVLFNIRIIEKILSDFSILQDIIPKGEYLVLTAPHFCRETTTLHKG